MKKYSEFHRVSVQLVKDIDDLMALMNDKEKKIYKDIESCNFKLNSISETEKFIEGFRLGVQIMCEVIYRKSENFC